LKKHGISCKLSLPESIKIHDVFHPSLLSKDPNNPIEGQEPAEPLPIVATEGDDDAEWLVDEILAIRKQNRTLKVQAKWNGYERDETWYPIENFRSSIDLLADFYNSHPEAPKPSWYEDELTNADRADRDDLS